jgi:hypothetical protein
MTSHTRPTSNVVEMVALGTIPSQDADVSLKHSWRYIHTYFLSMFHYISFFGSLWSLVFDEHHYQDHDLYMDLAFFSTFFMGDSSLTLVVTHVRMNCWEDPLPRWEGCLVVVDVSDNF